jgi:hypothetical protein
MQLGLVGREDRDRDVYVGGAEGLLPVVGGALTDVTQHCRAGSHAVLELRWEAVQGLLRDSQRLQSLVGEGDRERGLVGCGTLCGGFGKRLQPADQLASVGPVVDTQQQVPADVWGGAFVQRAGQDVVEVQGCARCGGHGLSRAFHGQWCSGGSGGFGFGAAR